MYNMSPRPSSEAPRTEKAAINIAEEDGEDSRLEDTDRMEDTTDNNKTKNAMF